MEVLYATPNGKKSGNNNSGKNLKTFYSIEFAIDGEKPLYQFKLWKMASNSMFALVKEGSTILDRLKEGEIFNMKYYSTDSVCPTKCYNTKIESITKEVKGRFKGHYMLGLEII